MTPSVKDWKRCPSLFCPLCGEKRVYIQPGSFYPEDSPTGLCTACGEWFEFSQVDPDSGLKDLYDGEIEKLRELE
jgi:hypothetical protein